jgi:mannose-6-phosphate isomerase-like protein (cupin superfamily)
MTTKGFTVSHLRDGKFERGLRSYLEYRYLDIDKATDGRVVAWHLRAIPGAPFTVGEPHVHRTTFQMVYVLKGWIEFEYEEKGLVRLVEGTCVFQPPSIRHREIGHSDDLEILEIAMPAGFETEKIDSLGP